MKIYLATKQIFRTDKAAYLMYRSPECSDGKAEDINTLDWSAWGIYEYTEPVIGLNQKRTDVVVDNGTGGKTFQVIDRTQEIKLANRTAIISSTMNPPPKEVKCYELLS